MTSVIAVALFGGGFFILMVGIAVRIVDGKKHRPSPPMQVNARALAALNERFALGEIDRDEYLERRAYLE